MPVTAQIAVNAVPGSNDNVPLDVSVALSNVDDTGVSTWEWALLTQPTEGSGPAAALSSTSAAAPTFTPNREGSYLIRLVVNKGLIDEASDQVIVAVRELETGNRVPAIMETTENSGSTGWAGTAVNDILRRVTRLTDGGAFVCIAGENLSPGDVVHIRGLTTIANGLPGQRQIPTINKALATALENVDGPMGVLTGNKEGQALAVSTGDYCRVMVIGVIPAYTMETGGVAGDPVYVSNSGNLTLTPGTYIRQVGDVANVVVDGTYDLAIAAVANSIPRGNAGGDLSGEYPNPSVAKVQGVLVTSGIGLVGQALRLTSVGATNLADWGPIDLADSNATTGSLNAGRGGTGQFSYAVGDILYASGVTTLSKRTIGANGTVLKSDGSLPDWGTVALSETTGSLDASRITGTLGAGYGGTGQNTYTAGNILYASGATSLSKLAPGTTSQVLRGGTTPSWGTVPAGAFASATIPYDAIQSQYSATVVSGTLQVVNVEPGAYQTLASVTLATAKQGSVMFAIMPHDDGTTFWNRVECIGNNVNSEVILRFVVTGPSGYSKTFIHKYSMPTASNELSGSITFPTLSFFATANGSYTVTASARFSPTILIGNAYWWISDYQLLMWQG